MRAAAVRSIGARRVDMTSTRESEARRVDGRWHRREPVVTWRDGTRAVALPVVDGVAALADAVVLDGSAAMLWDALAAGLDLEGATAMLVRECGASAGDAMRDAERFLARLETARLASGTVDPLGAVGAGRSVASAAGAVGAGGAGELDSSAVVGVVRAVLSAGFELRFAARGASMRPQIPDGSALVIAPRRADAVRVGDVLFYEAPGHRLVAHRVVAREPDGGLVARGDSAARRDRVAARDVLGVVVARLVERSGGGTVRLRLDRGWRRVSGLLAGFVYSVSGAALRWCSVAPLRRSKHLRAASRAVLAAVSGLLRRVEDRGARWRRRVDVARSALLTTADKDAVRRALYATRSVRDFTALDENVAAGLTLIEEVLLHRHPLPSGRVLVLGCGPGRESVALALRGHAVTGLDRDAAMLERARELARRHGVDCEFVAGEADAFDLGDARFGAVVVFSGLYNMLQPAARRVAMLDAARRHLAPDGRVLLTFLSDYVAPGRPAPTSRIGFWSRVNPDHEDGDLFLLNETVHIVPHASLLAAEVRRAGLEVAFLFRDQRAYDRARRQVRGYAVLAPAR